MIIQKKLTLIFVLASYFSENSLLPGLVKGGFVEDSYAKTLLASLQDEIAAHPTQMPYPWLLAQFRQIGLDAYSHNFTVNYPLAKNLVINHKDNVYLFVLITDSNLIQFRLQQIYNILIFVTGI